MIGDPIEEVREGRLVAGQCLRLTPPGAGAGAAAGTALAPFGRGGGDVERRRVEGRRGGVGDGSRHAPAPEPNGAADDNQCGCDETQRRERSRPPGSRTLTKTEMADDAGPTAPAPPEKVAGPTAPAPPEKVTGPWTIWPPDDALAVSGADAAAAASTWSTAAWTRGSRWR